MNGYGAAGSGWADIGRLVQDERIELAGNQLQFPPPPGIMGGDFQDKTLPDKDGRYAREPG